MGRRAVITGGGGYVGINLAKRLLHEGQAEVVHLLDLRPPPRQALTESEWACARFFAADIRDAAAVAAAFAGCHEAYHLASYGMSGAEQLRPALVRAVNVGGTAAVVAACVASRVPALVYCSTVNVVFAGVPIAGGDESSCGYVPSTAHVDAYSATKAEAERLALAADGTPLAEGAGVTDSVTDPGNDSVTDSANDSAHPLLRVCAVRPAGIYGGGEGRHLPRVAAALRAGSGLGARFAIGDPGSKVDWVYIDNLTAALSLAARGLRPRDESMAESMAESQPASMSQSQTQTQTQTQSESQSESEAEPTAVLRSRRITPVAAGQAYFISDGAPVNNFRFIASLFQSTPVAPVGTPLFTVWLPYRLAYALAAVAEYSFAALSSAWGAVTLGRCGPMGAPALMLTRCEVNKCSVTHYFSIAKAVRELGYAPMPAAVGIARTRECLAESLSIAEVGGGGRGGAWAAGGGVAAAVAGMTAVWLLR